MKKLLCGALLILGVCAGSQAWAEDAAQANNPLANMVAFNVQQYFIGELTESDDSANQFWLRYAQPFKALESNWLLRASLPINSFPTGPNETETGISDLNLFTSYLFDTGNPAVSFGFGPQVTLPTAFKNELGSEKWSAGLVNVLFNAESKVIQYGYLLTWQASFAGDEDRSDVNIGALQPFVFYQLGKGRYLRAAPIWAYNFDDDGYSVPVGVGFGQVIPAGKTVFNAFIEPQVSIADRGPGQPQWQLFLGFNMQFKE
ncbi:MAG: hypothetical protein KCHDKBKB_02514 [Elusimicrobia bacterium]|nr:hypothetical protein [Elusimicrobiota bacterium]